MSKILMRMRDVPEEEADEVRALLEEHNIETFETLAGNWGISMPAIWVKDESQFDHAKTLFDEYQSTRTEKIKEEYRRLKAAGEVKTLSSQLAERPVQFLCYAVLIAVVLFISIYYFFNL